MSQPNDSLSPRGESREASAEDPSGLVLSCGPLARFPSAVPCVPSRSIWWLRVFMDGVSNRCVREDAGSLRVPSASLLPCFDITSLRFPPHHPRDDCVPVQRHYLPVHPGEHLSGAVNGVCMGAGRLVYLLSRRDSACPIRPDHHSLGRPLALFSWRGITSPAPRQARAIALSSSPDDLYQRRERHALGLRVCFEPPDRVALLASQ